MEQIFGLSMNTLMWILVSVTSLGLGIVGVLAWKNPVILKLGVRNIPRRPTQTVLIIVGVMLSSIIISAAFGTGDTISYSIRAQAVEGLGPIDELVFSTPTNAEGGFGANAYFPFTRFEEIQAQVADFDSIDAIAPGVGEIAAALNPRTGLSEGTLRVTGVDPKSVENIGFLFRRHGDRVFMGIAMQTDLMSGCGNVLHFLGKSFDGMTGNEPARRNSQRVEQLQHARSANFRCEHAAGDIRWRIATRVRAYLPGNSIDINTDGWAH